MKREKPRRIKKNPGNDGFPSLPGFLLIFAEMDHLDLSLAAIFRGFSDVGGVEMARNHFEGHLEGYFTPAGGLPSNYLM